MATIVSGRQTARPSGGFVLFLVGMRINSWLKIGDWLPVLQAMGPMLRELRQQPERGFLHAEFWLGPGGIMLSQYWRDHAALQAYARDRDAAHLPAWQDFNRKARATGAVGIWHETHVVQPGGFEAIYGNMPVIGAAVAFGSVPVTGALDRASDRLAAHSDSDSGSGQGSK